MSGNDPVSARQRQPMPEPWLPHQCSKKEKVVSIFFPLKVTSSSENERSVYLKLSLQIPREPAQLGGVCFLKMPTKKECCNIFACNVKGVEAFLSPVLLCHMKESVVTLPCNLWETLLQIRDI